jgi:ATP synthase protein I
MQKEPQKKTSRSAWRALGFVGVVGWMIAIPTVLGVMFGRWLDANYAAKHSWTLSLLVAGVFVGVFAAWQWIESQQSAISRRKDKKK